MPIIPQDSENCLLLGRRPSGWRSMLAFPGLEVFAGSARIPPRARSSDYPCSRRLAVCGEPMPSKWIDGLIKGCKVRWLWLAPPWSSFSPLKNLDAGGPLTSAGCSEGHERDLQLALGNRLWRRALELVWKILEVDGFFILQHPRDSKAWVLGVRQIRVPQIKNQLSF